MTIAVVTGSASGIGARVRARLEAQGAQVIGIDRQNAEITADLSTPDGRRAAIEHAINMSGRSIDRLVLAAGLGGHIEDGQLVARVNYFGAIEVLDGLREPLEASRGRVVVISSNSAQMRIDSKSDIVRSLLEGNEGQAMELIGNSHGALIYGVSKHAVARAVRRRAADWGKAGITLNSIAPGQTETPMFRSAADHPVIGKSVESIPIPKTRVATADEIAGVIEFMLSDAAEYMQGSILYVDGGTDAQLRPDEF